MQTLTNETTIVSLSLYRSVFSVGRLETSYIHLYLTVTYYFPLLCEFTARGAQTPDGNCQYM